MEIKAGQSHSGQIAVGQLRKIQCHPSNRQSWDNQLVVITKKRSIAGLCWEAIREDGENIGPLSDSNVWAFTIPISTHSTFYEAIAEMGRLVKERG